MAYVRDLWTVVGPKGRRVRSARWGQGRRWQAVWVENGKTITKMFDSADAANLYVSRTEVGQAEGTWITRQDAISSDLYVYGPCSVCVR